MKRNGFCLPLHYLQIAAWAAVALLAGLFFAVVGRALDEEARTALITIYACGLSATVLTCFFSTKIDPTDLAVRIKLGHIETTYDYTKFPRLCIKCSTHVGARSKHCNKCDRCADQFDHHCDWLNNCVGKANYRWFVGLIVSLQVCVVVELAAALAQLKSVFDDEEAGRELRKQFSLGDSGYSYICTLIFVAALCVSIAASNGYLILFHCYLGLRHLTTYEFILLRRNPMPKVTPISSSQAAHADQSAFQLELQLPVADSRPIVPHCTPAESGTKSIDNKELSETPAGYSKLAPSRTIDVSSLPSFVERPTELEVGASYQVRKAREESVAPGEDENDLLRDDCRLRLHSSPSMMK